MKKVDKLLTSVNIFFFIKKNPVSSNIQILKSLPAGHTVSPTLLRTPFSAHVALRRHVSAPHLYTLTCWTVIGLQTTCDVTKSCWYAQVLKGFKVRGEERSHSANASFCTVKLKRHSDGRSQRHFRVEGWFKKKSVKLRDLVDFETA